MTSTARYSYIYILHNPSLRDNYLKIGLTMRTPEERVRELSSSTGVATKFVVAYRRPVLDAKKIEQEIHNYLSRYRVNDRREFFELPPQEVIRVVRRFADAEASIEKWKGRHSIDKDAIIRWVGQAKDLLMFTRFSSFLYSQPNVIDVWQVRDDGDEFIFVHDDFDRSELVSEAWLSEEFDLRPGDRISWISPARNAVLEPLPPTMSHLECQDFMKIYAFSIRPRLTPEGFPILISDLSPNISPELPKLHMRKS